MFTALILAALALTALALLTVANHCESMAARGLDFWGDKLPEWDE